jgi:hypothetical protein
MAKRRAAWGGLNFLDDLGAEGLEVTRIARGDDALVDHDCGISPLGCSIHQIGLDRFKRGHLGARGNAGLDQRPGCVAHSRHHFLSFKDVLDELHLGLDAQQIRIDLASEQYHGDAILGRYLIEHLVDLDWAAPILLVPAFDLASLQQDHIDGGAGLFKGVTQHFEFRLLDAVGGKNGDLFTGQFHSEAP